MSFIPSEENFGGREIISGFQSNHKSKLDSVKTSIHTRCLSQNTRNKPENPNDYQAITQQDFSPVHKNSRIIDKNSKFLYSEHRKNCESLLRRVKNIRGTNERKRNPNDPFFNPVALFKLDSLTKKTMRFTTPVHTRKKKYSLDIVKKELLKKLDGGRLEDECLGNLRMKFYSKFEISVVDSAIKQIKVDDGL